MPDVRCTISTNIPPAMGRRALAAVRNAAVAGADYHWRKAIPDHFKSGAATKYGYARRSPKYLKQKERLGRGSLPLVFSGRTQSEITGSRTIRATGTKGATLLMRASFPGASGNFRFKRGQIILSFKQREQLARVKEIEAITSDEIAEVALAEEREYVKQIAIKGPIRRLV